MRSLIVRFRRPILRPTCRGRVRNIAVNDPQQVAEAADRAVALDALQRHMNSLALPGRPVTDLGNGPARDAAGRKRPRWSPQVVATETLISEVSALLRQTHDATAALL
jgi:hypothetical protein